MQKTIIHVILLAAVSFLTINEGVAATWFKLNDNSNSKLSIDKQSIIEKDQYKRAWLKVEYKSVQQNIETPDKEYDLSKVLWYFDCPAQKSATSQVFQYLNARLVYSASIDVKKAEFIEPVPETDLDIAMRYVCTPPKPATTADSKPSTKSDPKTEANVETKPEAKPELKPESKAEEKPEPKPEASAKKPETAQEKSKEEKPTDKHGKSAKESGHAPHWTYDGKEGPENWGKLKSEFATCDAGRNQSPINIEGAIEANLKPLKLVQKLPAKEILNNGHTIQANFKEGNLLGLDDTAFHLKQVHFHAPSENTITGKSFPLEAHFVHADSKGNLAVIGVMFKEGKPNPGLEKLWSQMPKEAGDPIPLKARTLASEMIPKNLDYYRFSGSLTTPPCSEGVRWLVVKTPMTASKEQIEAFEEVMHHHNNRPVQPMNGRLVIE